MRKHTPWPWFVESGSIRVLADDPRTTIVCEVTGSPCNPQSVADASLIAAAPDLLAALIDVRDNALSDSPEMWARVNAAIAKATGEAP